MNSISSLSELRFSLVVCLVKGLHRLQDFFFLQRMCNCKYKMLLPKCNMYLLQDAFSKEII